MIETGCDILLLWLPAVVSRIGLVMLPIIVPARMNSQRLPGKPLRAIAGKPLLQWVIESLKHVEHAGEVVVATSTDRRDDALADWCAARGCACHRGPLDDVAARVLEAARARHAEAFVRVSGDSPLIDPALVTQAIAIFRRGDADLVTNVQQRTFPKGNSVEVVRISVLDRQLKRFGTQEDREHVTTVLYRHPELVRIVNFASDTPAGQIQLSVDSSDDLHLVERILRKAGPRQKPLSWREALELHSALSANAR
jgi:spore coat polysaccharide biosynthesis protein SpsF